MFKYNCLNPIANVGLDIFTDAYEKVENASNTRLISLPIIKESSPKSPFAK